ncbi:MAG: ABC transporter substrate-binding protein [Lachnospiraceae bacterium]|nr:ABC transporter substrate-binding protein [Lachnospiraceae bacterium]
MKKIGKVCAAFGLSTSLAASLLLGGCAKTDDGFGTSTELERDIEEASADVGAAGDAEDASAGNGTKEDGAEDSDGGLEEKALNETVKVTLNEVAHSIFYAPMYVAIEEGYFAEEGIDLDLVCGYGADKVMTAVLSGEADIGFMGPETTIYAANEGANDQVVNFAQLTQRAGNFLVAREETDDFEWGNLTGKTVLGGREGGMPEMVFEYILKQNGIDPDNDLNIDKSIDFGSTAAAFMSNTADYTVEFEPYATSLENEGAGYVVASLGVDSGYVPYTAFSAKSSFIEENPDVIQAFTNALQKGMEYVGSHSAGEVSESIAAQFPDTDAESLETIVARYLEQDTWKSDLTFTEESYELLLDILESAGQLTDRPAYEQLVTTLYAEKAAE